MRTLILGFGAEMISGSAFAEVSLSIPLQAGATSTVKTATYSCAGGEPFQVQYLNAGANALAFVLVEGEERIFANVVPGSGARYASGPYIWWSKGENATLENELEEGSLKGCVSKDFPEDH